MGGRDIIGMALILSPLAGIACGMGYVAGGIAGAVLFGGGFIVMASVVMAGGSLLFDR